MTDIYVATHNANKLREIGEILPGFAVHAEDPDVEETAPDFSGNALIKARAIAARHMGDWVMADDSGLEVDALDGQPGVYSARFAGVHGDDKANNQKLLKLMEGVENRGCGFASAIALCRPGREDVVVRGVCRGTLLHEERGSGGFGYDPLFLSDELNKTFAEAQADEKNAVSHRARAIAALRDALDKE